jgi:hypothetical protein
MALVSIPTPSLGWGFFFLPAEPSIGRLPREYPYASLLPMLRHVGSDVFDQWSAYGVPYSRMAPAISYGGKPWK